MIYLHFVSLYLVLKVGYEDIRIYRALTLKIGSHNEECPSFELNLSHISSWCGINTTLEALIKAASKEAATKVD